MKRMIEGKPVFDVQTKQADDKLGDAPAVLHPAAPEEPKIRKEDVRSFPDVHVKHVTTHFEGNKMKVYCHIVNTWHKEVMLDKIKILGTTREIDNFLRANEEREFLVYDGPKITKQYLEAWLDYKTQREGDYFETIHDVRFMYHEQDKTYSINDMKVRLPVRDIYG